MDPRLLACAYALLSVVALAGLTAGQVPLAVDLSNHATRLFIECNLQDPFLSRMYSVEYDLIPNLAIDLLNRPLCGLVDPMTVVRGAMVLAMAGILVVVWKLHRLLNEEPHGFVLLAPAMTFNVVTGMGYVNYLIGTFLLLLFAWSVLRWRLVDQHPAIAIVLPNLFGVLLFLCHIFALALAGVFLFGMRFAAGKGRPFVRRALNAAFMTAAAFAIPLVMMLIAAKSGSGFDYALAGKIRALWAPLLYWDLRAGASLVLLWAAMLFWAFREKQVSIAPALRWPLALLAIFSFCLPSVLLSATDLDSRCLVSVAFLAVAAIVGTGSPDTGRRVSVRASVVAAVVSLVTIAVQLGTTLPKVWILERDVAELRRTAKLIPPLETVLFLADYNSKSPVYFQLYHHLGSYITHDRRAFNPLEFTGVGMQPLRATTQYACVDVPAGQPFSTGIARELMNPSQSARQEDLPADLRYAYRWPERFDYVIYYHWGSRKNPAPGVLASMHEGSFFTLFRTRRIASKDGPC